jgi:hypothetical protein
MKEKKEHKSHEELPVNLPAVVAPPISGAVALNIDQRGFEDPVDQSDLIIPRAQLLQPTAEGLRQLNKDYGLQAGQVINNLTKEVLPAEFVPIFYFKEYLRFNARKKEDEGFMPDLPPGKLIWRTRDANDPRVIKECAFGPNGETPLALTSLNFFSLFDSQSMPVIVSFTKTSYKAGKNLLSLAKLRGGAMFSRRYRLTVEDGNSEKGSYFTLKVQPYGDCSPEMFRVAESYFNQFAMKRDTIRTHVEEDTHL